MSLFILVLSVDACNNAPGKAVIAFHEPISQVHVPTHFFTRQTSSHFLSLSPRFSLVRYCSVLHPFMYNSTSSASNCCVVQCYFEMGARSMCGGSRRKGKAFGLVRCNALANEFHEDAPLFNECNWIKVTFPLPPNEYVSYGVTYCARPTSFIPQRCPICGRAQLMRGILCCAIQGIRSSIQCER